jgi:hypothetical protein
MNKWERRDITPKQVIDIIDDYGAPTTSEIKFILKTDTVSIRKPLGALMAHNKVFPMPYKGAIAWMRVTGRRGMPQPGVERLNAGKGTPRQEGVRKRVIKETTVTDSKSPGRPTKGSKISKREQAYLDRGEVPPGWD